MNPDTTTDSDFTPELREILRVLPPPIRTYLRDGKHEAVAARLMQKYSLHVDQGSTLEFELTLLLMGVRNPDDFASELKKSGIPENIVMKIMTDVNQEVFVPLQNEMRVFVQQQQSRTAAPVAAAAPMPASQTSRTQGAPAAAPLRPSTPQPPVQISAQRPAVPQQPVTAPKVPPQTPPLQTAPAQDSQFHLINKLQQPMPATPPPTSPFANPTAAPQLAPVPGVRDMRSAAPSAPLPPKAAMPQSASFVVPRQGNPFAGRGSGGAPMPSAPAPAPQRFGMPPQNLPGTGMTAPKPPTPPGSYSVDPYRETPE